MLVYSSIALMDTWVEDVCSVDSESNSSYKDKACGFKTPFYTILLPEAGSRSHKLCSPVPHTKGTNKKVLKYDKFENLEPPPQPTQNKKNKKKCVFWISPCSRLFVNALKADPQ